MSLQTLDLLIRNFIGFAKPGKLKHHTTGLQTGSIPIRNWSMMNSKKSLWHQIIGFGTECKNCRMIRAALIWGILMYLLFYFAFL
ncbi:hypothetical protein P2G88_10320 [Aliiglaciecola sp. CAU 1673]|uniref:hypothetical protein n=1 Tax=Aliiglaciecola sp. CAU 1673 TaxID=3032595 RepID=UPI0023DC9503|nr:hypothetical protein [Aliiglaciecola sp. CAU 1673]MDF2178643.1 hypothetical protein [Aliiglaciecola sp. CAU 1673]